MKFGSLCRGDGIAYIEVTLSDISESDTVKFRAYSEKNLPLPCEAYPEDDRKAPHRKYVITTPLLDTRSLTLEAIAESSAGTSASARKTIDRSAIKWLSRLNYKLNAARAWEMRDIDRSVYSDQIHINPLVYLTARPNEDELIFKGTVCSPSLDDGSHDSLRISLLDAQGEEVPDAKIIPGTPRRTIAYGLKRSETSFSARIPLNDKTYCLVASCKSSGRTGFFCFDEGMKKHLIDTTRPVFYRLAQPYAYSQHARHEERILSLIESSDMKTPSDIVFSIVVPLYKTPAQFFHAMTRSVIDQLYPNWELILVNASPEDKNLSREIEKLSDPRIKHIRLNSNEGISENTNEGIKAAQGDFILLLDHDDLLTRDALFEYAKVISADNHAIALYCDEDLLNEDGLYVNPHLKSDFNIDLLRCHNYITHLLAVKTPILKDLLLRKEYDGAQDYDLVLRLSELPGTIKHIPRVLYHWRQHENSTALNPESKQYAEEAGRRALAAHLHRKTLSATAETTPFPFFYRVKYKVADSPLVSILIPNKDNAPVLERCIESIFSKTSYRNFEIIVVENNSVEAPTFELYEYLESSAKARVVIWKGEFNYSAINNFGAKHAKGEYLLLLNNDTEVITDNWLEDMLGFCQREDVGAVGARLLYPDGSIQHAGIAMVQCQDASCTGGPIPIFNHIDQNDPGYMRRASIPQDLSAVTAACMMTKKNLFEKLRGLDEDFTVAFNDVDYCLRVREEGLLVVYCPYAELTHYESLSRGMDDNKSSPETYERFLREQAMLRLRWSKYYANGDPYHSELCFS